MGKFDGLLLVSDFDDTLYDFHHRIPPRNLEALGRWIGQGGRFTVATGRAHRTFAPYVHLAPINAPVGCPTARPSTTSRRRPCWSRPCWTTGLRRIFRP